MRDSKHSRRRNEFARYEEDRRTRANAHRRPSGAARALGAVGKRKECEGISRHHGPQTDRGHFQRWPGRAVSLERLGAKRSGDSPVGGGWGGERVASMVHKILRRAARRTLAQTGRRNLSKTRALGKISAQRTVARPCGTRLFAADGLVLWNKSGGPYARLVSGPDRSADSLKPSRLLRIDES